MEAAKPDSSENEAFLNNVSNQLRTAMPAEARQLISTLTTLADKLKQEVCDSSSPNSPESSKQSTSNPLKRSTPDDDKTDGDANEVKKSRDSEPLEDAKTDEPDSLFMPPGARRKWWNWACTEGLLTRCHKAGIKGTKSVWVNRQQSVALDVFYDFNIASEWIRRNDGTGLPLSMMRGPNPDKAPKSVLLDEDPLQVTRMPKDSDVKLSPHGAKPNPHLEFGNPPPQLQDLLAFEAWAERSPDLKAFESLSLQMESLVSIQAMAVAELLKHTQEVGKKSSEIGKALSGISRRIHEVQTLNDLMVNRVEVNAYSIYKASKCLYLEAAGVPVRDWGMFLNRKWQTRDLFPPSCRMCMGIGKFLTGHRGLRSASGMQ
ncbi:unnamed protein product [Notodromas monacha]|uniref:Uncharacterized protein n=1 Tax=Notodromas monacha TaxID=399045 RepID=A0A7R9BM84_9CRUS|nr:unnamed protein product [Notodromas monacha]CAG0916753.1 unnamed protein product [Notodromas monacha]